ncbi:MAG: GIY-YIG nuclease family protein [Verrucomicrobiota bacterium]
MVYVYRIQSRKSPSFGYTGYTTNLKQRLAQHNSGEVASTSRFAPFGLVFYAAFPDKRTGRNFEDYLKTGSGKAFARKRLWPSSEDNC